MEEGFECVKDCIKTVTTPPGWITLSAKTTLVIGQDDTKKHWNLLIAEFSNEKSN